MSVARKFFIETARHFNQLLKSPQAQDPKFKAGVEASIETMCKVFKEDNSSFDVKRFTDACQK